MLDVPLSALRGSDGLRLPVGATPSEQLNVQLARTLGGSTAVCNPTTDGEWPDSALAYVPMRVPDSAAAFIRQPGGTLLVEGVWDTPQHQAASATIVGALQYLARASGSDVRLAEDAAVQTHCHRVARCGSCLLVRARSSDQMG